MQRAGKEVGKVLSYLGVCGHEERDVNTSPAGISSHAGQSTVNNKLSEVCLRVDTSWQPTVPCV